MIYFNFDKQSYILYAFYLFVCFVCIKLVDLRDKYFSEYIWTLLPYCKNDFSKLWIKIIV